MIPQRSRSGKGLDGRFGTYTHTQPNSRYSTRTQLCSQFVQLKNRLADLEKCIHLRVHNLSPGLSYCICCGFAMEKRITGTGRRGGFFKCNRHIGNPPAADYKFCNSCGTHITFAQFQQYMAEDYPFELELARETRLEKVEFNRAGWAIVYELVQSDMELSDFIRLLRDLRLSDIPLTFSPFSSLVEARHSLRSIPTLEACLKSFALKPDPKDEEPIDDYSPYIARAIEVGWNSNRTCPQCRKRAENPTHLTRKAMLELATDDEKLDKLFTELKETRSKFISVKRVLGR